MIIAALLLAAQQPPVDWLSEPNRSLTFEERVRFDAAFRDPRRPRLADVLVAETVLARFPCLGPMKRWRRIFSFGRDAKTLRLDTSLLEFTYVQAGLKGRPAGRQITGLLGGLDRPDQMQYRVATGVYSIRTHLATLTFCGFNMSTP